MIFFGDKHGSFSERDSSAQGQKKNIMPTVSVLGTPRALSHISCNLIQIYEPKKKT